MIKIVWLVAILLSVILMIKVRNSVSVGKTAEDILTKKEKVYVWTLCILNPLVAGALFYYGWKKRIPKKAHQANQISLWAFLIILFVMVGTSILNEEIDYDDVENITVNNTSSNEEINYYNAEITTVANINYCESLDSKEKDFCLIEVAVGTFFEENVTEEVINQICLKVSEGLEVLCYSILERCDLLEIESEKVDCELGVEEKNSYIENEL